MIQTNNEREIRNMVFKSYLKREKGERLTAEDKANIEAWEMLGKYAKMEEDKKLIEQGKDWLGKDLWNGAIYRLTEDCFAGNKGDIIAVNENRESSWFKNMNQDRIGSPFIEYKIAENIGDTIQ